MRPNSWCSRCVRIQGVFPHSWLRRVVYSFYIPILPLRQFRHWLRGHPLSLGPIVSFFPCLPFPPPASYYRRIESSAFFIVFLVFIIALRYTDKPSHRFRIFLYSSDTHRSCPWPSRYFDPSQAYYLTLWSWLQFHYSIVGKVGRVCELVHVFLAESFEYGGAFFSPRSKFLLFSLHRLEILLAIRVCVSHFRPFQVYQFPFLPCIRSR